MTQIPQTLKDIAATFYLGMAGMGMCDNCEFFVAFDQIVTGNFGRGRRAPKGIKQLMLDDLYNDLNWVAQETWGPNFLMRTKDSHELDDEYVIVAQNAAKSLRDLEVEIDDLPQFDPAIYNEILIRLLPEGSDEHHAALNWQIDNINSRNSFESLREQRFLEFVEIDVLRLENAEDLLGKMKYHSNDFKNGLIKRQPA